MAGRGRKVDQVKNERAHADWMAKKKENRPYQTFNEDTKTWQKLNAGKQ